MNLMRNDPSLSYLIWALNANNDLIFISTIIIINILDK